VVLQVVFRGLGLSEGCCVRSELELRAKPATDPRSQRLVQGKLCLTLQIEDASSLGKQTQREEEEKAMVAPRTLQLQVHRALHLPKPGFLRSCDPFVVVKWGGREVGRTQAVARTTDPQWPSEVFDVVVTPPMVVHMSSSVRGSVNLRGSDAQDPRRRSGSLAGGREGSLTWHQGLLLEVYRTEGEMIGRVGVSMEDWASGTAIERPKGFDITPLRRGAAAKGSKDKPMPAGTLFLRMKVKDPADPASLTDLPPCKDEEVEVGPVWPMLRIDVVKAVGLTKADYFGKSDPFCILTWKGQEVGRTKVVEKSLDPVWAQEHFDLSLVGGLDSAAEGAKTEGLLVEVYDMNRSGKGMFLGQVLLTVDVLAKSGKEERAPNAYTLHSKPVATSPSGGDASPSSSRRWSSSFSFAPSSASFSSSSKAPGSLGSLTLAYDVIRDPRSPPALRAQLSLEPQRLVGLPNGPTVGPMDKTAKSPKASPSANAYVLVLRCNGQEAGRTPRRPAAVTTSTGETAVVWKPREVTLTAQSDGGYHVDENEMVLELWEWSAKGGGERRVAAAALTEAHFRVPPGEEDAGVLNGVTEHSRVVDIQLKPVGAEDGEGEEYPEAGKVTLTCRCVCVLRPEDHPLWVADPSLSLLQLRVLRAIGLAKADLFGKSDPFCIVKWGQEEVGRTKVVPKTLDPVWDQEQFSVDMQGDPGHTPLTLEVWDMDAMGVGEFLGLATILRSQLARESDPEVALELQPRPHTPSDKHVKGTLFIKYHKASPAELKRFDTIVKLTVLEAHGLAKADLLGKSDPFCIVKWEGKEVGRTKVLPKTLDPVWGEDGSFSVEQTGNAMDGLLTLELWDMNGDKQGSFLGQVVLKGADLRTPTDGSAQFDLQPRPNASKAEVRFVRGYLSIAYVTVRLDGRPVPRPATPEDMAHARALRKIDELLLQLRVHECVNLSRSTMGRGGSTYCAIRWNGREVGRTPSISAVGNPRWDTMDPAAGFRINVPPDRSKMRLQVEVWTQGLLSPKPELLGWVTLRNDFLIHAAVGPRPYRLQRSDSRPDKYPSLESFVVLELGVDSRLWADCVRLLDAPPTLTLQIHDARGLAKADLFGQSDPFCIVKWQGREVGRTKVIDTTLDPDWEDEVFELTLPEDPTAVELVVEVWDMDKLGMGDFLGQAMLSCGELLRLPPTRIEYALRGKQGASRRENRLVQGRLGFSVKQKSPSKNSKMKHEVRPYVRSLDSRNRSELGLSSIDLQTLFQNAARPGGSSCILYEEREMVVATFSDLRVRVGGEWVGPSEGCYRYALTACGPTHYSTFEDAVFARQVIQETQLALRRLRGSQQRAAAWDLALAKMRTVAEKITDYDTAGYYQALLDCLELPLLGCDMYLSLLAGGGQLLRCVGATAESGMLGKEWRRGVGVSFKCVGNGFKTFLVVQLPKPSSGKTTARDGTTDLSDTSAMGVVQGAMDGTTKASDTLTSTAGMGSTMGSTGSVVSIRKPRLHGRTLFDQMRVLGDKGRASMPFVCVPLLHDRCTVGVLGVDNFNQVGGGGDAGSPHPEASVLERLREAGAIMGEGMDRKRRHDALVAFDKAVSGHNMSAEELYSHALRCLLLHSPFGVKAQVWKLDEHWDLHVMASVAHTREDALHSDARMLRVSRASLVIFPQSQLGQRDFFLKLLCGGLEKRASLRCAGDLPFWDERFDFKVAKGVQCLHAELWAISDGGEVSCLGRTTVSVGSVPEGKQGSIFAYLHAPAPLTESVNQAASAPVKGPNRQSRPSLTGNNPRRLSQAAAAPLSTAARPPIARLTIEAMRQHIELVPVDSLAAIKKAEAASRRSLRVTIVEARGLARADLLGSSDPFVIVRWNEKEMGRTETVPNSLNPKWDSEVFNLNLPHGGAAVSLVLEVWDQDAGMKGDFLGQASLTGEELLTRAAAKEPVVLTLGDRPDATKKTEVKGEIVLNVEARDGAFVEGRVGQVDKRLKERMMDLIDGVRQQMGVYADKDVTRSSDGGGNVVLRLTVVDALHLAVTNVMLLVRVNGVEKARTRVVPDSDSPRWRGQTRPDEHSFILAFDALPSRSAELEVCLEVWTVAGSGGEVGADLLPVPLRCVGMVLLRGERLHRLPKGDVEYDLEKPRPCPGVRPSDVPVQGVLCINAAWAALQPQSAGYEPSDDKAEAPATPGSLTYIPKLGGSSLAMMQPLLLRLQVFAAEDLPRADAFGSTDPYCVIKWRRRRRVAAGTHHSKKPRWSLTGTAASGAEAEEGEEEWEEEEEEVGRSHVVSNSLHPEFDDAIFYARLRGTDDLKSMSLVVEVWDKSVMGPGELLGVAVVGEGEALLEPCLPDVTRDLYPKQAKSKKALPPQGSVRFSLGRQDPAFSRQVLEVNIKAAHGLANADFLGKSDPIVILYYDGKEAGRTRTLQNTLHPVWDETFVLHLPVLTDPGASSRARLRLEVWDMDLASQGDFLGMVEIAADELLQPTGRPEFYSLQPKPGQVKKLNLVQGFLELRWLHRCLRLCAAPPERVVSHVPRENVSLGVDVMVASDPVAEELRLKKEKLKLPEKLARTVALAELCDSVLGNPAYRKGMELKAFEATIEMPRPRSPDGHLHDVEEDEDDEEDDEEEETGVEGAAAVDGQADLPDPESTLMSEVASGQLVISFVKKIGSTVLRGILYDRLVVTFSDDSHYPGSKHAAPGYAMVLYCRAKEVYATDRAFGRQIAQRLADQLTILRQRQTRVDKRQQTLFRLAALCGPHITPLSWAAYVQQRAPGSGPALPAVAAVVTSPKHELQGPIKAPPPAPFTPETLVREALRLLSSALGHACTITVYLLRREGEAAWCFKLAGSTLFAAHHAQGREAMQPPKPVTIHRGEAGSAHLFRVVEEEVVMLHLDQRLRLGHPSWASIAQGELVEDKEGGGGGGDFIATPLWDRDQPVGVLEVTGLQSLAIQGQRPESSGGEAGGGLLGQVQETVLEDGVVAFVRDAGVQLGAAVARLRKKACVEALHRQLDKDEATSPKVDETMLPTLLRQTTAALRAACPYAASITVWELKTDLESLRDPEVEKEGKEGALKRGKTGIVVSKEKSVRGSDKRLEQAKSGKFSSVGSLSPLGSDAGGEEVRGGGGSLDTSTITSCTGDSIHANWTLPGLFNKLNCLPGGDAWVAASGMLGRCFGAPETEDDVAAAARVADMKPTALRIAPTAKFSIQTSDAEVSAVARTGRLKLGPLELPGGPLALQLLAKEWYRQLLNVDAEHFFSSTGHLVLLLRRRRLPVPPKRVARAPTEEVALTSAKSSKRGFSLRAMSSKMSSRAFGLGGEAAQDRNKLGSPKRLRPETPEETEALDYAIVIAGWMDRVDLDFVVKVARLVNQVIAIYERQRKPTF
jgi:Ca2+-dependent lipid-binding protein